MMLPADLDRAGIETARQRVEGLLNCLTAEAESWAAAGSRKSGEIPIHSGFAPRPMHEPKPATRPTSLVPSRAA
jgi:hypothetical protein